ncbi:hypothetical protein AKJ51_00945 [candidate division MSBL1 archaeon SCGC-AAA382A20]|uniref:Cell division protein FtsZ n=1 Tax=candidate division MSBL1 archaeon SCGC-AAA382A20 TaxID=1698280 RepID=A0A133VMB3_9EURY|nr:hypothetical protein AKJ51_00945 [candidate division MSBL1 archaeon SCGC-AAA382A20]
MSPSASEVEEKNYEQLSGEVTPEILVIGCGGAGCNTVSHVAEEGVEGVDLAAVNTDAQDLLHTEADKKVIIGKNTTGGLGTGSDYRKGKKSAMESEEVLEEALSGYELVFITCGLGGGTGTGAGPVVADIAKNIGALAIGVVTLPFESEGERRNENALDGLFNFRESADTTIVIPDDRLLEIAPNLSLEEAFKMADGVLVETISGVTDLMSQTGLINLDFEDVRATFENGGMGVVGFGESAGSGRAEAAVEDALNNPLLDMDIENARRALINITGSPDMELDEAEMIAGIISEELSSEAKVTWGARISEGIDDTIMTTIIVSGAETLKGRNDVLDLGLEAI